MHERDIPVCRKATDELRRTENRAWVRYPCNAEISIQLITGRKDGSWRPARLRDITAKGLGLLFDSIVEPGTIVSVKLEATAERFSRPLLVRVKRARKQPGGGWHIGGTFAVPLGEDDLRALLPSSILLLESPADEKQAPPPQEPDQPADTHKPFVQGSINEDRLFPPCHSDVPVIRSTSGGSDGEKPLEALAIDASLSGLRLLLRIMTSRESANASDPGINQIAQVAARLEKLAGSGCD